MCLNSTVTIIGLVIVSKILSSRTQFTDTDVRRTGLIMGCHSLMGRLNGVFLSVGNIDCLV